MNPCLMPGLLTQATPKHRFAFANKGKETVTILEAKASCGCLAPRLSERRFKPGEEGNLELE